MNTYIEIYRYLAMYVSCSKQTYWLLPLERGLGFGGVLQSWQDYGFTV